MGEYIIQSAEYNQYLFECNKTKENLEPIELLPGIMVAVENESKAGGVDDDESPDGMGRMSLAQKRPIVRIGIYELFLSGPSTETVKHSPGDPWSGNQ